LGSHWWVKGIELDTLRISKLTLPLETIAPHKFPHWLVIICHFIYLECVVGDHMFCKP
jgi:hypothetical protein